MPNTDFLKALTPEEAARLLPNWEAAAAHHAQVRDRLRTIVNAKPPPPDYPPAVLLIWTPDWDALKGHLNPILSDLVAKGLISDTDPPGDSEGWEWRPAS